MPKTAFISIVGCPNVGKSSILNSLLGQKIAIVSDKPQTTRTRIMGILTNDDIQLVFTDTPGIHKPRNKLGEKMLKAVSDSVSDVDACLLVVEPDVNIRPSEYDLINKFKSNNIPAILAINKVDTIKNKEDLMLIISEYSDLYNFNAIVPVSALRGTNMEALLIEMEKLTSDSVFFFPEDALTDQPERVIAAEIIREKLLRFLDREIPHGTAVCVEKMKDRENSDILDIDAVIYCEKESHKGIIIGKNGTMLKKISSKAREDLERFFMCRINLHCWVKVKEGWRNREGLIHNFGLD